MMQNRRNPWIAQLFGIARLLSCVPACGSAEGPSNEEPRPSHGGSDSSDGNSTEGTGSTVETGDSSPIADGGQPSGGGHSDGGDSIGGSQDTGEIGGSDAGLGGVGTGGEVRASGGTAAEGCASAPLPSGDFTRALNVDGQTRTFLLHVPAGYLGDQPLPLLIDYHGLGGSAAQQSQSSGFAAVANQEGFLAVWPDGLGGAWDMGACCTNGDVDDVAFARELVADVSSVACVDAQRVYAAGFSNGGGMSYTLACQAADLFAAVAPSAFDLLVDPEQECRPVRPISVLSLRGTNDSVVPYPGGPGSGGRVSFAGAEATLERWASINGCTGTATEDGSLQLYTACDQGVEVGLYTVDGGGHSNGPAAEAWRFLAKKRLP